MKLLQFHEITHFLRGVMGDVLGQVVLGTPSIIDEILFPEVCSWNNECNNILSDFIAGNGDAHL